MARINPKGLAAIAAAGLTVASPFLIHFIGKWEGEGQNIVYADTLAGGIPTVCTGITHWVTDTPVIVGEYWSDEKCNREVGQAVTAVQSQLVFCFNLNAKVPQRVFDMATSHAWNLGVRNTCNSQAMQAWKSGDWLLGCRRLALSDGGKLVWSYADGKFIRGLANRRADEWKECAK